jgi:membrane-associated phospholipid phosphatase
VAASNPLVNSFAKLANFLVDDDTVVSGFWGSFILTSILRSVGYLSSDSCLPVTCLSFILHTTVWCLFESAMKLVFKRARPPQYYYRQKETGVPIPSLETMSKLPRPAKGVMLPGDQHSWPSGHTLRGFGLARLLVHDPLITNTFNNSFSNYEYGLLCVAIIIGWARMALGRHTLGDVIAGVFCMNGSD